eukprot:6096901-Pleurochrysis_carterae.AAC.1
MCYRTAALSTISTSRAYSLEKSHFSRLSHGAPDQVLPLLRVVLGHGAGEPRVVRGAANEREEQPGEKPGNSRAALIEA